VWGLKTCLVAYRRVWLYSQSVMRFVDAAEVRAATPWPALLDAITEMLGEPDLNAPPRHVHPLNTSDGSSATLLLMPAWIKDGLIGVKTVSYFPSNAGTPTPTINAAYLLIDGSNGKMQALLDGDELTDRRTAAVSALAANYLARPDAERLLIVGTGRLAPNMARAHASVRPLKHIEIWGRRPTAAQAVVEQLCSEGFSAESANDLDTAIASAHIVSCVTGATSPLVRGELLAEGAHLDLVGSFSADMRESDDAAVLRASIFVDTWPGASLSGDLAQPLIDGIITPDSLSADLQALTSGAHPGRRSESEITLFKSAGFAAADLAAARLVLG